MLKITKFVHSCVLVETDDRAALFDPGEFSWQSGTFDINKIDRIDRIAITHEHADHLSPQFIKTVLGKFPQAHIVCNKSVESALRQAGIQAMFRGEETDCLKPFAARHEQVPILSVRPPENTGFHFKGDFTHPGDSHSFTESKRVLALPVIAPWGSTTRAVELALNLKPAFVLPIHDWHYSEPAKNWLYDLLEEAFADSGITLIKPEYAKVISV